MLHPVHLNPPDYPPSTSANDVFSPPFNRSAPNLLQPSFFYAITLIYVLRRDRWSWEEGAEKNYPIFYILFLRSHVFFRPLPNQIPPLNLYLTFTTYKYVSEIFKIFLNKRNWVLVTNSNCLISLSLQSDDVNLWYFNIVEREGII